MCIALVLLARVEDAPGFLSSEPRFFVKLAQSHAYLWDWAPRDPIVFTRENK